VTVHIQWQAIKLQLEKEEAYWQRLQHYFDKRTHLPPSFGLLLEFRLPLDFLEIRLALSDLNALEEL
jgi:hypothetical protein